MNPTIVLQLAQPSWTSNPEKNREACYDFPIILFQGFNRVSILRKKKNVSAVRFPKQSKNKIDEVLVFRFSAHHKVTRAPHDLNDDDDDERRG